MKIHHTKSLNRLLLGAAISAALAASTALAQEYTQTGSTATFSGLSQTYSSYKLTAAGNINLNNSIRAIAQSTQLTAAQIQTIMASAFQDASREKLTMGDFLLDAGGTDLNIYGGGKTVVNNLTSNSGNLSLVLHGYRSNGVAGTTLVIDGNHTDRLHLNRSVMVLGDGVVLEVNGDLGGLVRLGTNNGLGTMVMLAGSGIISGTVTIVGNGTGGVNDTGVTSNKAHQIVIHGQGLTFKNALNLNYNTVDLIAGTGANADPSFSRYGKITLRYGATDQFKMEGAAAALTWASGDNTITLDLLGDWGVGSDINKLLIDMSGGGSLVGHTNGAVLQNWAFDSTSSLFGYASTKALTEEDDWGVYLQYVAGEGVYLRSGGVIPEPSTWLLLGAGATVLVVFRRRRKE